MLAPALFAALTCGASVAPSTLQNIITVESHGNPLALGVNGDKLLRQPADITEAVAWAKWLVDHGYNIDAGLMQLNVKNWNRFGVTAETVFDPCTNVRAGAAVLTENYLRAAKRFGPGQKALLAAISAYNTGNFVSGFGNGYVRKVAAAAGLAAAPEAAPPLWSLTPKHRHPSAPAGIKERASPPPSSALSWAAPVSWTEPEPLQAPNPFTATAQESPK